MDSAEAHRVAQSVTGGRAGLNEVAAAFGHATETLETFAAAVRDLVEVAESVVDDDGREVWMTSGEVELDQWTQRLTDAAAIVRRQIGGKP